MRRSCWRLPCHYRIHQRFRLLSSVENELAGAATLPGNVGPRPLHSLSPRTVSLSVGRIEFHFGRFFGDIFSKFLRRLFPSAVYFCWSIGLSPIFWMMQRKYFLIMKRFVSFIVFEGLYPNCSFVSVNMLSDFVVLSEFCVGKIEEVYLHYSDKWWLMITTYMRYQYIVE